MSVKRNLFANYLGSGWNGLLGLAMLPIYLGYLGIESWGLIGFFVTLQAWFFLFDMGLTPTLNREMARFLAGKHTAQSIADLLRSMEVVFGIGALLMASTVVYASPWLVTNWLKLQSLSPATATQALACMGVVIAVQWMGALYRSAVLGLQDQVWLSVLTGGMATLRALSTVAVLAWVAPTVTAFVFAQGCVSLLETAWLALHIRRRLPRPARRARFSPDALRGVWRFAAGLTAITVLATLLTQVDKLLLAKLLPLDQFGYFSLAIAVAAALSLMVTPIHNVGYPRLSELVAAGAQADLARDYHHFAQLMSITVLPAALMLGAFSHEIMLLWTRDAATARNVAPILSLWVVGTALNGLMHVPYAAQLAHGWTRLALVVNAAGVAVMVPAMLLWVPQHGAIAAAWIWAGLNAGYAILTIGLMHRRILRAEKWRWYVQDVLSPLGAGVTAVVAVAILHSYVGAMDRGAELCLLLAGGALVTLAVMLSTSTGRAILRSAVPRSGARRTA